LDRTGIRTSIRPACRPIATAAPECGTLKLNLPNIRNVVSLTRPGGQQQLVCFHKKKVANFLPASELSFFFISRKYAVLKEKIYQKCENIFLV
jgi:hypothetical protein